MIVDLPIQLLFYKGYYHNHNLEKSERVTIFIKYIA